MSGDAAVPFGDKAARRLRVLIVDDEPLARQAIRLMLAGERNVDIVGECSGVEARTIITIERPDLIFLDVQMPEVDGFDLIEMLGVEFTPVVIFVTAYSEHALRAFEVHAIDYLLKPVTDERFAQALARGKELVELRRTRADETGEAALAALLRARSRITKRILVRDRDRTKIVDADTIDWIEAADYYALIHAAGEKHLLRETMSELAERLDPAKFFRAHRSAIVNLDRVKEIHPMFRGDRTLVLADGTHVRLSRKRRAAFEAAIDAATGGKP